MFKHVFTHPAKKSARLCSVLRHDRGPHLRARQSPQRRSASLEPGPQPWRGCCARDGAAIVSAGERGAGAGVGAGKAAWRVPRLQLVRGAG